MKNKRKVFLILLSVLLAMALMPTLAFGASAEDDDIESITFEQKDSYELIDTWKLWTYNTGDYSNVPEWVEDGDQFWLKPDFQEGDRLIVNKTDGTSITYEAKRRSKTWVEFENLQDENDTLGHSVELVTDRFWAPEKTYPVGTEANVEVEVTYQNHSVKTVCAIKFSPNPYTEVSVEGGVIKVFEGDFGWTTDFSDIEFYITKNGTKLKFDPASSFDSDREYLQLVNQDIGEEIRVNIYDWGYSSDDGFWEIGKTYRIRFYFVEAGLETEAQVETAEVPYDCSKLGHDWNGGEYEKEPNCKENGIIKYTCNVCGETITEEVPSEPSLHKLITHEAVEATCGKDGNSLYSECELCGKTFAGRTSRVELAKDRWVIPATGNHSWDAGKVTKSPTYTSTGTKKYTCTACGKTKTETIAKLAKVANPLSIKAVKKTVKASKLKKKAVTVSGAIVFTKKGEGKVTYSGTGTNAKSKKALKINASTGKITVKKGTKKGSYKMKVKVKAAGTAKYKAGTKTATVTITVN